MQSLRFSFHFKSVKTSPERLDGFAGRQDLQQAFVPVARRYRKRLWWGIAALVSFLVLTGIFSQTPIGNKVGPTGLAIAAVLWISASLFLLWHNRLKCPGCRKPLAPANGAFCPCCGSEAFAFGMHRRGKSFRRIAYCPTCGIEMDEGMGDAPRAYRIHGCTHCGAFLDRKGI